MGNEPSTREITKEDLFSKVYEFAEENGISVFDDEVPVFDGDWYRVSENCRMKTERARHMAQAHYEMAHRNHKVLCLGEMPTEEERIKLWSSIQPVLFMNTKWCLTWQDKLDTLAMASTIAYEVMERADKAMYGPTSVFFLIRRAIYDGKRIDKKSEYLEYFHDLRDFERETAPVIDKLIYRDQKDYTDGLMEELVDIWVEMCNVMGGLKYETQRRSSYKTVVRSLMYLRYKTRINYGQEKRSKGVAAVN